MGLQEQWTRSNPGPPLRVLHTECASAAGPILAFIDQLREQHREQIVVLIPVVLPDRARFRLLQNHYDLVLDHYDLVLATALRKRPDVVSARVPMPLHLAGGQHAASGPRRRRPEMIGQGASALP